ncbi:MAG: 3-deoxy-D-manno-octulosonic acid transferase [Candidatus Methylacidiphilales bacterium]
MGPRQILYNVAFAFGFVLMAPAWAVKMWRRGNAFQHFGQRLGRYSGEPAEQLRTWRESDPSNGTFACDIWIRAVSVGEMKLASILLLSLRRLQPELRVAISTTTSTGYAVGRALEDERTLILYSPIDFAPFVTSAFRKIAPRRVVLIESDIWPNWMWTARRQNVPVYLANARMSERSERRYIQFAGLVRPLLGELTLTFAQETEDVQRLTRAGFPAEGIFHVGSMKYDVADLPLKNIAAFESWWSRLGWAPTDMVLLAGSTHAGEEELFARMYLRLRQRFPTLRMVIAPRHAERGKQILATYKQLGLNTIARTWIEAADPSAPKPDVLILNTTGELMAVYQKATIVYVGKSLGPRAGGQNFIEAARFGRPIIVGPNMQNFPAITREFLQHQAIVQIKDGTELEREIENLCEDEDRRAALGERARRTFAANLGAADRTAQHIAQSLQHQRFAAEVKTPAPTGSARVIPHPESTPGARPSRSPLHPLSTSPTSPAP